jgi:hypothetical protein
MLLEHYPLDILLTCLRASGKIKYLLYNRIQNCIHKCRPCSVETRNDINVVQHSLVFFRLDEGPSPAVSYEIHGQAYDKWYYPTLAKQMGNSPTKMHAIDAEHPKKILLLYFVPRSGPYFLHLVLSNSMAKNSHYSPTKPAGTLKTCGLLHAHIVVLFIWTISVRKTLQSSRVLLNWWEAPQSGAVFLAHKVGVILPNRRKKSLAIWYEDPTWSSQVCPIFHIETTW